MARRPKNKPLHEVMYEFMLEIPWWAGLICIGIAFAVLRWFAPWLFSIEFGDGAARQMSKTFSDIMGPVSRGAAPLVTGVLLLIWGGAQVHKSLNRRRLDRVVEVEDIRSLSWREFEELLGEYFRRSGFQVQVIGGATPDGGIDLRLEKAGQVTLVQCKHWRTQSVGVGVVRELLGVVVSESADSGIVVSSGTFTEEARRFAESNPVRLIGGEELAELIAEVRHAPAFRASTHESHSQSPPPQISQVRQPPACPKCRKQMTLRTARQGANAGSQFWGCPGYPTCRGTRQLDEA